MLRKNLVHNFLYNFVKEFFRKEKEKKLLFFFFSFYYSYSYIYTHLVIIGGFNLKS